MLDEPQVYELTRFNDDRGSFSRLFCADTITLPAEQNIKHVNCSQTTLRGTVRGMHFQQPPFEEIKLVTCTRGEIMDVCIDMRENSKNFGVVYYCNLNAKDSKVFVVPNGFAHGFQSLSDFAEIVYSNTQIYSKVHELNVNPGSPQIKWPVPITNLSKKDSSAPQLSSFIKD